MTALCTPAVPQPWYRERWPWILMSGPAAVIVAGAITTWIAFASADGKSISMPIASPVDFISGPRYVSTPISFDIENTGALTATRFCRGQSPGSYP